MISNNSDTISARNYAMNLASYGNIRNVPEYVKRIDQLATNPTKISFEEFYQFHLVLDKLPEIDFAINSFECMGEPFSKTQLQRTVKAVAGVSLPMEMLDIIFFLFDRDGDGKLDQDEFIGVLKGKNTFGFSQPRDSGFVRFSGCLKDCLSE